MPHRRAAALGPPVSGVRAGTVTSGAEYFRCPSTSGARGELTGRDQVECLDLAAVTYSCLMPAKPDPAEIGDVEPLADSTARQARRVVAAYATDADECRVFLSMLGIGPAKNES
jgi:hypothetical protein